jgi:hypothetical protein
MQNKHSKCCKNVQVIESETIHKTLFPDNFESFFFFLLSLSSFFLSEFHFFRRETNMSIP